MAAALSLMAFALATVAPVPMQTADVQASNGPVVERVLDETELADLAGGAEPTDSNPLSAPVSVQVMTATNSGNSVNAQSVSTGGISLAGAALSNATGIGNYVFNTGNNNNVMGSITVNVILGSSGGL